MHDRLTAIRERLAHCRAVMTLTAPWSIVRHYVEDVEWLLERMEDKERNGV